MLRPHLEQAPGLSRLRRDHCDNAAVGARRLGRPCIAEGKLDAPELSRDRDYGQIDLDRRWASSPADDRRGFASPAHFARAAPRKKKKKWQLPFLFSVQAGS